MASDDPIENLSRLTERQLEVLRLVCDGLKYKDIGARLYITEAAVKSHMANIYIRLELEAVPASQRKLLLFQVYCQALHEGKISPVVEESGEPEPVPEEVIQMVEQDEISIVPYRPKPSQIIKVKPLDPEPPPRRRSCSFMIGIISGMVITVALGLIIWRVLDAIGLFPPASPTEVVMTIAPPTAEPSGVPELPSPTPLITEVIVVVTATPLPATETSPAPTDTPLPPTEIPTPTPQPNTPAGSHLQPGETWKQDGFHLTLDKVEFDEFFGAGIIRLEFSVTNRTGAPISIALDRQDITVQTNNGTVFPQFGNTSIFRDTLNNDERVEVWLGGGPSYEWKGDYHSPDVTYILVIVRNWSRIPEAIWQIDINH
jgi:DNA-binding CsgD family transcriptional regulator